MKQIGSAHCRGPGLPCHHAARRRGGGCTGAGGDRPGRRPGCLTAGGAQSIQYALVAGWGDHLTAATREIILHENRAPTV